MAASAAGVLALAGGAVAVAAETASGNSSNAATGSGATFKPPADSLRALAAKVHLRIGTAATPADLSTPALSQITSDQFSVLTPENEMKWQVVEPQQGQFDWTGADNLVNYAEAHGELVRGHTLVWHNQLPNWLTTGVANGTISDSQLRDLLHQHITTEVSRYRGKIWQWDVVNEMLTDSNPSQINPNDFWISHLGTGIIADAFRWAHAADPHALLFYNDYNIAGEDGSNAKFNAAFSMVKNLLAEGVPIDGVGDQGHLDLQFGFNPTLMTQDLQEYASLGLKVAITEADVRTFVTDSTTQTPTDRLAPLAEANWYDGMLGSCLAVKACISFTVWGFDDSESWVPATFKGEGNADLYDVNLNPKPAYTQLQETLGLAAGAPHR
jgi:endo-1,4-beta-xylanase